MGTSITVVDFDAGNLLSVCRALSHCGGEVHRAKTPEDIATAERLVLPGVGAFGACMDNLERLEMVEPLRAFARSGRPFLGICVGMQMLFDESLEFGHHHGLGLIAGQVATIPPVGADGIAHSIPHIGWNALQPATQPWSEGILDGITPGDSVYFIHSFAGYPTDPTTTMATCDYDGVTIVAAVRQDNLTGCQFHPEKSGTVGLRILSNFLAIR